MLVSVEVSWPIDRPISHAGGYPLFGALCRAGLIFHGEPGVIVLPPGDSLTIRCPPDRAGLLAAAPLPALDVDGIRVHLGRPTVSPLGAAPSLRARMVTIKGKQCDAELREAALRQLELMGVGPDVRASIGRRRVLQLAGRTIVGYGMTLDGLADDESLIVQSRGIGGRTRMGCGAFVPR